MDERWGRLGLESEPALSIFPLTTPEEMAYFVNREEELRLLGELLGSRQPRNVLLTGPAGAGKTSLAHRALQGRDGFVRVDLSQMESVATVLDRIILQLALFADARGLTVGKEVEGQVVSSQQVATTVTKTVNVGVPAVAAGKLDHVRTVTERLADGTTSRERQVGRLLEAIGGTVSGGRLPVVLLDDLDHLPEEQQEEALRAVQAVLLSRRVQCLMATRQSQGRVFARGIGSRWRHLFEEIVAVVPLRTDDPKVTRKLLAPRFGGAALPFADEALSLLGAAAGGNVRELMRFAGTAVRAALLEDQRAPLEVDFVGAALVAKGYLVGELDDQEAAILAWLAGGREVSASEGRLLKKLGVGRSRMSQVVNDLAKRDFLVKVGQGRRVLYRLAPKGHWCLKVRPPA